MTDKPKAGESAPEFVNVEQDDEPDQAQTIAEEALAGGARDASPLDSTKNPNPADLTEDSTQDLVDHMKDMEQSGRIDMGAFDGEDNHDDEEDKYGEAAKPG